MPLHSPKFRKLPDLEQESAKSEDEFEINTSREAVCEGFTAQGFEFRAVDLGYMVLV